jgi:serine/threonine-protein kinase PknG
MNCHRSGCSGTIDDDGFCDVCGMLASGVTSSVPKSLRVASNASAASRRPSSRSTRIARPRLGAGLVEIAPVPADDPAAAIIPDPHIPEERRFCGNPECGAPVGRSKDGQPGRTDGFCTLCGHQFSFRPQLAPGDLVAGQYAIVGCIAHGGLGWIYLARDRNVADKWVVLKGLLNRADPDALAVALAELRFLAEIDHPNIVRIINGVEHAGDGYIVMDHVPGSSLRATLDQRRQANRGTPDPLPVDEAIAYMLEILPAFAYLHRNGLLYCDFKPDNVMHTGDAVKLIDLGGAYRIDEPSATVYGTRGYQAPEIAERGPSVSSDLFTVGRTLLVLCTAMQPTQRYEFTLPTPDDELVFRHHDALYRFLQRATAADPDDRFQSADEMAAQLLGVLREVVAEESGRQISASSELFAPELRSATDAPDWRRLPTLLVSSDDPAAGFLASLPGGGASVDDTIALLAGAPEQSVEVRLRHARLLVDAERVQDAQAALALVADDDPWEWRVTWYRGLLRLQGGAPALAVTEFDAVYRTVPGELAPKLAMGFALEQAGELAKAEGWYDTVSRTDPSYPSAAFGLARCRLALGDLAGGLEAYDRVPETANAYPRAQLAKADAMLGDDAPHTPEHVAAAAKVVDGLPPSEGRARLTVSVFELALDVVRDHGDDGSQHVLGRERTETDLRFGLEAAYRSLARFAPTAAERFVLVDRANDARPITIT